jgi:serine/threonine-protein kinase
MPSSNSSADYNLLFGVLALQADLLDAARFAEACSAWAARKDTPLADLLVQRGWLSAEDRSHVEYLLQRKLKKHNGDARASLAEVTTEPVRQSLASVADADVQQSLAALPDRSQPVLGATTAYEPQGRGRYSLTQLHAQGGIGQVWLARDSDLGRDVALKELRAERNDHPTAQARFLEEARITGQLEHPGIVPVYELVHGEDGKPFYTMRMVRGRTLAMAIKDYHARRQAGQAGPLELRTLLGQFVAVCQAVAYAHSRKVLHRDLKPANVVLGDYGEVVVLDWGLARLLGTSHEEATSLLPVSVEASREETMQGQVLGTPAYMSPEQAQGRLDLLGPASDVYSLGAILYELLTAVPPFSGGDTPELLQRVVHEEPVRPRQLVPSVPSALEAVCLKALAKKPGERYASAAELAQEVERWRADEPVSAWREPWRVRAGRWVRRHPSLVGACLTGLLLVLLLGSGGGAWWSRERQKQRSLVESALERAGELQKQARWQEARDVLEQAGSRLGGLASADLLARLQQAQKDLALVARLDAIRLEHATLREGKFDAARTERRYAEAFAEAGLAREGEDVEIVAQRLRGLGTWQAVLAALDDWAALAEKPEHESWLLAVARRVDPDPQGVGLREPALWQDKEKLAQAVRQVDGAALTPPLAVALGARLRGREEGEVMLRQAQQAHPADFWLNYQLAWVLDHRGKAAEAEGFSRAALALRPDDAVAHNNLGVVLWRQGKSAEAEKHYRQAIARHPRDTLAHYNLGVVLDQQGKEAEAEKHFRKAIALDPSHAQVHNGLGLMLGRQGKVAEAEKHYRKAIDLDPRYAQAHAGLGWMLGQQGKAVEAEKHYRKAIDLDPRYARAHTNLGVVLMRQGKEAEAEKHLRKAIDLDPRDAIAHYNLGVRLGRQGKATEAEKHYRQAIDIDPRDARPHYNLGVRLGHQGKAVEAEKHYRKAIELNPRHAQAHTNLGLLLKGQGKDADAEKHFRQAIALDPSIAQAHTNLGLLLARQGRWAEAASLARMASARGLDVSFLRTGLPLWQRLARLEPQLPAYLTGQRRPRSNDDLLALARLCQFHRLYAAGARLYADDFAADAKLADDLKAGHRYNAACFAALAAAGKGSGAGTLEEGEKARLRGQALTWLRADLTLRRAQLDSGKPADRQEVQATMRHWQQDSDFAGVRSEQALAALPQEERLAWASLWRDVAALLELASRK